MSQKKMTKAQRETVLNKVTELTREAMAIEPTESRYDEISHEIAGILRDQEDDMEMITAIMEIVSFG